MKHTFYLPKRCLGCACGATAIEYGFIAALIFLAMVAGFMLVSDENQNKYNTISQAVDDAM